MSTNMTTTVNIESISQSINNDDDMTIEQTAGVTMLPTPVVAVLALPATIIILLTVFGNLLVLCFKARVGRTNTTLLVWNLGLTDFLVGIFVLPLGAFHLIYRKWIFGRILCRLWVAADVTFCTCSVVTICIISVDRYLAVTRPLRYKSVVTKTKVILVMIIIWTFSSSILLTTVRWDSTTVTEGGACFAGNEIRYLAHSVVFAFFLPASVTLTLYWRIYRLARNRQKALDRGFLMILGHNMNFLTNTLSQQTTLRVHFGKNNGMVEHQRRVLRTHERIAKTLGVVSCSFLFCWLPFFSLYLTNFKCDNCIPSIAIDLASWLGYCNSMLNPIIYSFTVKEFKRSALRFVLPIWKIVYRIFPFCLPIPPENIRARMSRTGGKMTRTRKPLSFELRTNKSGVLRSAVTQRRRLTEPAVFSLQSHNMLLAQPPIIEEDEDAMHELSENTALYAHSCSVGSGTSPIRSNGFLRPSPKRSFRDVSIPLTKIEENHKENHTSAENGNAGAGKGAKDISSDVASKLNPAGSPPHQVRVYCDTKEADL